MGNLEGGSKKRTQKKNLQRTILLSVAAVGLLSTALVAPNVIGVLAKQGYLPRKSDRDSILRSRKRLVEKGLLSYEGKKLRLTRAGEAEMRRIELANFRYRKPARWDKKWRIIIFDIPEAKKALRDKVRRTLESIGFARLQHSVWIFPYDCEDLLTLLKADFKIGKDVLYIIADALEYDVPFRKHFDLPL